MPALTNTDSDPCLGLDVLVEGRTKIVYRDARDPNAVLIRTRQEPDDGETRQIFVPDWPALSTTTTCNAFKLLNEAGIRTHFLNRVDAVTFRARQCEMVGVAVVVRRIATGSYLRRFPAVAEGARFRPPLIEFFEKNDLLHDPHVIEGDILGRSMLTSDELATIKRESIRAFDVLERAWALRDVVLVDVKFEFGRCQDRLLLADVVDNDSWRIWPGGHKEVLKDKLAMHEPVDGSPESLARATDNYRWVAEKTETFPATGLGKAVLLRPRESATCSEETLGEMVHVIFRQLHDLGIACDKVQSDRLDDALLRYDADGRPVVVLVLGAQAPDLEESVPYPVISVGNGYDADTAEIWLHCQQAAWQAARILAVADPSLYGRLLAWRAHTSRE